ncbi:hypothetical protein AXF42_Ash021576 [Apostasia shenzhenica]|uniref:Uncharacterized protein n=1 Tax=Apostasia shenzhenica TaxID=1088818 RepID=A0A2H9ZVS8_9ASPA|nr:hypothetical protein AXF42_Ash021576 [Apostasia shenzhenica]
MERADRQREREQRVQASGLRGSKECERAGGARGRKGSKSTTQRGSKGHKKEQGQWREQALTAQATVDSVSSCQQHKREQGLMAEVRDDDASTT